ncbi:hypothetical protein NSA27_11080 [Clostridium tepidum]|nr:CHASE4 domain-containing protein [Clostridium tepidum]MCR1935205.1 hypothetical protein [Clostridium tepidum]
MKLYKKSLTIVILIFLSSIIIIGVLSKTYIIKKFNTIEIDYNISKTEQLLQLINKDIKNTYNLNQDYGMWDNAYKFVNNRNNNYIEAIISENNIFENFNIDLMILVDKNNNILLMQYYNKNYTLSEKNINHISSIAISNLKSTYPLKGLIKLDNSLLLMTSSPITDSFNSKPSNGAMILIKFLTKENINKLYGSNINFQIIDYKNLDSVIYKKIIYI